MLIKVLQLRYVLALAVLFTLINSVLCLVVGIRQTFDGYRVIFRFIGGEEVAGPKVLLLESLDSFLAALVFLIFGLGIVKIFIAPALTSRASRPGSSSTPSWSSRSCSGRPFSWPWS